MIESPLQIVHVYFLKMYGRLRLSLEGRLSETHEFIFVCAVLVSVVDPEWFQILAEQ
jgi:hypothetical protein